MKTVPIDARGVLITVTVTGPTSWSWLTVYPDGSGQPITSSLNFLAGQTVSNEVEVMLGGNPGAIRILNGLGTVHVIVDVEGWISSPSTGPLSDGRYQPVAGAPFRILDSRGSAKLSSSPAWLKIAGSGPVGAGVPASGIEAVVINVTATNPSASSWLTVFAAPCAPGACSPQVPGVSNLNYASGSTVAARVTVRVGAGGYLNLSNAIGSTDVIVDVDGWFTDASQTASTAGLFTPTIPTRILDTRGKTKLSAGNVIGLDLGSSGVVPANASAVVLNLTVTNGDSQSWLTVYASDSQLPGVSDLNWAPGKTVANMGIVRVPSNGLLDFANGIGSTDVIVDVVGWYG